MNEIRYYNFYPMDLYYKTLQIRNVRNIDILHSKLVCFVAVSHSFAGLDKHSSLLQNLYITIL